MSKSKATKSTQDHPHVAGCGCIFCHDERKAERKLGEYTLDANSCRVLDGKRGRPCILPLGHKEYKGVHFTGKRFFCDPELPWNRPENLDDTGRRSVVEVANGPARLRIVFVKDRVGRGECGLAWDGEGAPCSKASGHLGKHKSAQTEWVQDISEEASTLRGQPCNCGGSDIDGHMCPLGLHALHDAWCAVPHHEQCACNGTEYAYHLGDLPGCENAKSRRKGYKSSWRTNKDGAVESIDRRDIKPANDAPEMIERTGETITCQGVVYRVHPAARLFPTPRKQYEEIRDSIKAEGLHRAIELLPDGTLIEGCTRLRACAELGITPIFKTVHVEPGQEFRYVIAANLARRHLDESLRAIAAFDLANLEVGSNQHSRASVNLPTLSQGEAAKMMNVSPSSVGFVARVTNKAAPEVIAAMRDGRIKASAAAEFVRQDIPKAKQREIVEKVSQGKSEVRAGKVRALVKQEAKRDIIEKVNTGRVAPLPDGPFGVIYVDYPWFYENSDQHEGSRGHVSYAMMKMPEILEHARQVAMRAAKDCVIAMWVTNAYIHEVGNVLAAYGATMQTMVTWDKATKNDKDKKGMGSWPRGRTEHLVFASIGKPVHTLNEIDTLIRAAVREHSRKPDEFADILRKHCVGPHLELFACEQREGWVPWGAESEGSKRFEKAPAKKRSKIFTKSDQLAAGT